ncbi:MAG: nuclear transport factor 2 family protein [Woeseia sp.]
MNIKTIFGCAICLIMVGAVAYADESDALVQLDKEWGEAEGPEAIEPLLADDIVALGLEGVGGKSQILEAAASDDAPTGPYVAGDYKVRFLSKDVAVMTHSAAEPDPHWSMHIWQKRDGKWQVAATATVPIEE